ncbi:MAG: sigma-70 family RNA polymerase sigma factor [Clostridia bacterium]|nr:sigma-70 family RNA polymerase sigma factor [Clostridia bacterium]
METFDWEKIYLQNADLVYRFLLSRCHDKYLAEDLTSETFLQAHRCQNRYNGACKLSVWLCQIGKHLLYQHYEKQRRQEEITEEGTDPSAEDMVFSGIHTESLYRRIHGLPEPMREVVYLRITGELSFAAIGEILGKSENWARVTFYRAKLILQKEENTE